MVTEADIFMSLLHGIGSLLVLIPICEYVVGMVTYLHTRTMRIKRNYLQCRKNP